jgi:hypothetical protein
MNKIQESIRCIFQRLWLFLGNAWDLSSALMLEKSCHVLSLPGLTNCNKLKELG